jgi:hypothetical protein
MRGRRLDAKHSEQPDEPSARRHRDDHAVLALQRGAGNAAVTRMLQRDDAPPLTYVRPGSPLSMRPTTSVFDYSNIVLPAGHGEAVNAVVEWFGRSAAEITSGRSAGFLLAMPELVKWARELPIQVEGKQGKVGDHMSPGEVESLLRDEAKRRGVRLLEHRSLGDRSGARSELAAIMENLGRIPTQIELGGDSAKLVLSIAGKATGELSLGKGGKLEAEGSAEGGELTYTAPGGKGKITGRAGPEGGGGSLELPGGKVSIDVTDSKVKAEVKAGDLLTVRGSAGTEKDGSFAWRADIQIGTLGKIITVEEMAKLMIGAQDTFGKAASDLSKGFSVEKAKDHGGAVKDAVKEVVEKAEKSAKQAKSGWSVGGALSGTDKGGWAASVTLTWVF